MASPADCKTSRTFTAKVRRFIKTYPLTYKDPMKMISDSLDEIVSLVKKADSIDELECLSETAKQMTSYSNVDEVCQFPVNDEKFRYIIYRPIKLLEDTKKEIIFAIDLLYIPDNPTF